MTTSIVPTAMSMDSRLVLEIGSPFRVVVIVVVAVVVIVPLIVAAHVHGNVPWG
jgi:hypothetical protein